MTQKAHMLKPTEGKKFPTRFLFLDTETNLTPIEHKIKVHSLKMGACIYVERVGEVELFAREPVYFKHKHEFMDYLNDILKDKSTTYIIAHNIVYDVTILDLFRELPKSGFALQSIYSKGQTCIIRWKRGECKITMLDNGNIFSGSLERWGIIFDIPKISIDFDTCTDEELRIYCKRDVEIMVRSWQVWLQFLHENDCGGFRETVGSTAFNTWRHKHLQREVYVHKEENVLKLERQAYHGGRVEAFHQGLLWTDHYYYLDINNMYGYVMQNSSVPVGLQGHAGSIPVRRLVSFLDRYAVIARVIVSTDEPLFITKVNGHAAYPLGRFETTLTTNELNYALSHGYLESVQEIAWYKSGFLFSSFIDEFYRLRLKYRDNGNTGFEAICKLIINSLYGKFGQTGITQKVIGASAYDEIWSMPCIDIQSGKCYNQTSLGGAVYETYNEGESYHSLPSIAAHITANARLYLWSFIKLAGRENVYYCDTDSLIVNSLGYYNLEHLIEPNTLGKLKVETHSPWLIVNAPKDYEMSERKKIKGIRSNALEIAPGIFIQEQWMKLAGLLRDGFQSGYTSKEIIKRQQRVIYSGVVGEFGQVEPFQL